MRKLFLAICLIVGSCLPNGVWAQSFSQGQKDMDVGIGLGNSFIGSGATGLIPPISFAVDYGLQNDISVGGYLGFSAAKWKYSGTEWCTSNGPAHYESYVDTYSWTYFIIGARGAYHFAKFVPDDKVDLYAGLMLGDDIATYKTSTTDPCPDHSYVLGTNSYGGFIWSMYAGCRYHLNDQLGVFGELGYGIAYLNIGVNYRF